MFARCVSVRVEDKHLHFKHVTQNEALFVHEGASGTVPLVCLQGSLVTADTPTHDSDLILEK